VLTFFRHVFWTTENEMRNICTFRHVFWTTENEMSKPQGNTENSVKISELGCVSWTSSFDPAVQISACY
jgi:hypothetical protein